MDVTARVRGPLAALIGADTLSRFGNIITLTAIPWFVLETTGSATRTGIVVFAGALAIVLSLFFGGPVIDRISYQTVSIVGDLASGTAIAAIAILHITTGLPFLALVFLVFLGTLLDLPAQVARYSVLPDAASRAGMPFERANAMFEIGITSGALLGPAVAGLLIASIGAANVLWFDVGTFLVSAALVATRVPGSLSTEREDRQQPGVIRGLAEGLRFVRREPLLFPLILFLAAMNLVIGPIEALLLPVYASVVFDSAVAFGIMATTLAAGSLAGNVVAGWVGHRLPRRDVLLVGFLAIPVGLLTLAPLPSLIVVLPVLALIGFGLSLTNMVEYAIYFERIPATMRARLLGITGAIGWLTVPIGRISFGFLLDWLSLGTALLVLGFVALPVPFAVLVFRALRTNLPQQLSGEP